MNTISLIFGVLALMAICAAVLVAWLYKSTPVDRYEDGADSERAALEIADAVRPHRRAGAAWMGDEK